jgi:hypothetical protein
METPMNTTLSTANKPAPAAPKGDREASIKALAADLMKKMAQQGKKPSKK